MLKRLGIIFALLLLVGVLITGCGGKQQIGEGSQSGQGGKKITIKVAHYFPETHPQNKALMEVFKPEVEKNSNGKFVVEIYPNNQLGGEKEFIEGVRNGTIEMAMPGLLLAENLPKLRIAELPYLFRDYDHARKVYNSPIKEQMLEGLINQGIRPLAITLNGLRAVSNSKHPINSITDTRDIKLRVPQNPIFIDGLKAMGFNVVSMPMSELFSALQQKVVDGQENPPTTLLTSGWYEVQPYLALTNHILGPNIFIISEKFWQTLTSEDQKVISEAAKKTAEYEWDLLIKAEKEAIETLKQKGIQVTTPDLGPFREAVKPVYEKWMKDYPEVKPVIEAIQKM
ncbi:tripartite ATP-independent transporter solute receptor, DctP family [Thermanaeromonas toyohensis ToBE]|uniref:Tripartite ATP-independent transporter solute receptor, DctP family n=1 Tax=Thermanaeromonas toyohensis ToBE TaxID=698762 RepID=A0A1W1W0H0_9FIRM|nr:TRAP transporter substrate-binding protein [Thermanaeromonas toyohensis]SMB98990.1 tripartite ATP-independent transporter solute receptor, DctP family [Thermanaeromonas toyohensis ToBE]